MATITPRGKYQWQARIRRAGFPEQIKTCETKVDAEKWARDIESKMDRGTFVDKSPWEKITLKQTLMRYKDEITPEKRGKVQEQSKLNVIARSKLARMTLGSIEPGDIVDYRNERLKKVSAGTVIKELNLLSSVYIIATSEWRMRGLKNPVKGVRRPKAPPSRDRRLTSPDEMDELIRVSESPVLKALIPFAVETAMRRSEMVTLTAADVDLMRQTATLGVTKNGDPRVVPLSRLAVSLLREIIGKSDELLFKIKPNSATQAFSRAVKRARKNYENTCRESGIDPNPRLYFDLVLHDMRHEGTSRLFEKGFQVMEVSKITGHKDLRMLGKYTHLDAEALAKKLG